MKLYHHRHFYQHLDLRLLLVGVVIALVVFPWRPGVWEYPSVVLKEVGVWLSPAARKPPAVAVLTVDRPELALWSLSGNAEDATDQRLPKVLKTLSDQEKTIGIVLPHPVDAFNLNSLQLESLLESAPEELRREFEWHVETRRRILSDNVVLGLTNGLVGDQAMLPTEATDLAEVPRRVREWLWPLPAVSAAQMFPSSELRYFPVLSRGQAEQPLVASAGGEVRSGFALALLHRAGLLTEGEVGNGEPVAWQHPHGIALRDGSQLATSANGTVVPLVAGYSTMLPSFARLTLEAAIARPVQSAVILIGSSADQNLERLASTLVAVANRLTLTQPYWYAPANKLALVALLTALLLIMPRISWVGSAFMTATLAALLAAAQLWMQLYYQMWLPVADLLWCLVGGALLMQVWLRGHYRWLEHDRHAELMMLTHAQRLTEQGDLEEAQQMLLAHASSPVYKPYLSLAEAFASRGDYARALETVSQLDSSSEKLGELKEKQAHWAQLAETPNEPLQTTSTSDASFARTLVLEAQKPHTLGRYEVQQELGRGAMGTVYLAYDPKIARKVAIKTLNFKHFSEHQLADTKARFCREAAAAGRLDHPHIVSVFDVGEEQSLAYIAMEYVEGQALSDFVTPSSLLRPFEVYRAIAKVARALHYAHQNGVIHRDIKPANIIYNTQSSQLKVTDFGIARLVDESRTSTGEILGSPSYISPEQLQGKAVTPSADVFSLGVTFYQLLTGCLPFQGDNLASLTYEIIYGKPRSVRKIVPGLPSSATRIINRALQKDVAKRFDDALQMAEAIEKAMRRDFADEAKTVGTAE